MEQLPGTVRDVLDLMGRGALLLVNENEAHIFTGAADTLIGLNLEMAREIIRGRGSDQPLWSRVSPLSQFRWEPCGRLGWRELVGHYGERFDVFGLVA